MRPGEVYAATRDGKPVGFKVVEVLKSGQWQPHDQPYDESVTLITVHRVKTPGVLAVVKYHTAEGALQGWKLIEEAKP